MVGKASAPLLPKLRFPEFEDDPGWSAVRGDELFDSINKRSPEAGLPALAITQEHGAVPRDQIDYHVTVSEKSVASYKEVCEGDFIISLRSFQGGIEYSNFHGICSPAYIILRRKSSDNEHYFRHLFKADHYIRQLTRNIEGLRDGKMISYAQFSEQPIPLPRTQAEQKKIAECLGSLDDVIASESRKLDALRQYKKGLMQKLFPPPGETVPRLRFPEFQDAGEWEEKKLSDLATNLNNMRVPITAQHREPGDVPYYGATGIVDYVKDHIFDEELLCVSEDGANLVARTYPIAFSISGKTWVNNHAHVLRFRNSSTQVLARSYLNHIDLADFITGVAQPKLNRANLDSIPIACPKKFEEQDAIANCILSIESVVKAQKMRVEILSNHKCGLLQQLFPSLGGP